MVKPAIWIWALVLFGQQRSIAQSNPIVYPRVTGYVGLLHPLAAVNKNEVSTNFDHYYLAGLPTGINIWKSAKLGFSAEFVPFVRADSTGSKMSNFLFHPGVLIALGKGWVFAGRLAFETSGRYGLTPVLNKTVKKNKSSSYFIAIPFPLRFGNAHPSSYAVGFQFGIAF